MQHHPVSTHPSHSAAAGVARRSPLLWVGLGGVSPDDNPRAQAWQARLHWAMVAIAMLAIPAYVLDSSTDHPRWKLLATAIDAAIFVAFLLETFWMASISSFPRRYLVENWLNLVILLASAAALLGASTEWIPIVRVLRAALGGLVMLKVGADFSILLTRRGAPLLTGIAVATALVAGATFYWLEPNVPTFWDGVWLSFVTATTIGYGDIVPTTGPSRVVAVFVALIGWALLSLFTANVVALFLGRDELIERRRLHRDLMGLQHRIDHLGGGPDASAPHVSIPAPPDSAELAREVEALRAEVARLSARFDALADQRPTDTRAD